MRLPLLALLFVLSAAAVAAQNNAPIVLVHGFAGWGRSEVLGFKYWGGVHGDLEKDLMVEFPDTRVVTVEMGPVSSNWDRVCEMYAQIVGGTVDYGLAHSRKFNHSRFGRTYKALVPEWGSIDPATGELFKVHMISHSMGGQDVRLVSHLLTEGSAEEREATPADQLSGLFTGGKGDWLLGAVTISSPHDGTTLASLIDKIPKLVVDLVAGVAAMAGAAGTKEWLYDFKVDQFGLFRQPGESFEEYANNVFNAPIWNIKYKDISLWDLSPEGTIEFNQKYRSSDATFWMSYPTEDTYTVPIIHTQMPKASMLPIFWPFSALMGSLKRQATDELIQLDNTWWVNDGVVNTCSMNGPTLATREAIVPFNGTLYRGLFNLMGSKAGYGHAAIIGINIYPIQAFYHDVVIMLKSLPADTKKRMATITNVPAVPVSAMQSIPAGKLCQSYMNLCGANSMYTLDDGVAAACQQLRGQVSSSCMA